MNLNTIIKEHYKDNENVMGCYTCGKEINSNDKYFLKMEQDYFTYKIDIRLKITCINCYKNITMCHKGNIL